MISRKPSQSKQLQKPPPLDFSPWSSPPLSDCEADDEDTMSTDENIPSRPLSIAQYNFNPAGGPYYPTIPTLHEILSNSSPPPWSLSAFTAYLSQNHCLETLEFTTDAERYRQAYDKLAAQMAGMPLTPECDECEHVRMLWRRLIDAYIVPDGPREVNIPGDIRHALLSLPNHTSPPSPEELNTAVKTIYDLMDGSVLLAFVNEVSPHSRAPPSAAASVENLHEHHNGRPSTDSTSHRSRSRRRKPSPPSKIIAPPNIMTSPPPYSPSGLSDFDFGPFSSGTSSSHGGLSFHVARGRLATHTSNSSTGSMTGSSGDPMLTDDSGSPSSPGKDPMTPPGTPPSSDVSGTSPRNRGHDNTWRKMIGRLGTKKKSSSRMGRMEDEKSS